MENQNKSAGLFAMVATAFLWSIAGLFIKIIDWNPIAIAGLRSLIASIVIFLYLKHPKIHFSFPQITAAIASAATMLLFVAANKTTTAANAILLQYFAPVLTVLIGAIILKERARVEHFVALPLIAAGMLLMFMDELSGGRLFGNVLAILSAITFSFYFVFMRMQKDGSPLESILLAHWLTAGLRDGGRLVVLDVTAEGGYGTLYDLAAQFGAWDHPKLKIRAPKNPYPAEFLSCVRWKSVPEKTALVENAGFKVKEYWQTLTTHPLYSNDAPENPIPGYTKGDYVAVIAVKEPL